MDISDILASQAAKQYVLTEDFFFLYVPLTLLILSYFFTSQAVTVEKDIPLEVDAGYLTVTDLNPTDPELYSYAHLSNPPLFDSNNQFV